MYSKEEIASYLLINSQKLSEFLSAGTDSAVFHTTIADITVYRCGEEWIVCGNNAGKVPCFESESEIDDFVIRLTTKTEELFPFLLAVAENIKALKKFSDKEIPSILAVLSGKDKFSVRLEASKNRKLIVDFVETQIDLTDFRNKIAQDYAILRRIAFLIHDRSFGFPENYLKILPDIEKFLLLLEGRLEQQSTADDAFLSEKALRAFDGSQFADDTETIGKYRELANNAT